MSGEGTNAKHALRINVTYTILIVLAAPPLDPSLYLALRARPWLRIAVTTCRSLCCAISADNLSAVAGRPCVAATRQSAGCLDSYRIRR